MNAKDGFAKFPHSAVLLFLMTGAVILTESGRAQEAAAGSTNDPTRLPLVTVTAQKEPAAELSVPVSMSVMPAGTIRDANISVVKTAAMEAPNTFINEFSARALSNPFFRGIGGSPGNPAATTFIDGVPQLNTYSANIELVGVDQVEFARGSQGALFGRNTAGGLINITSRRPSDFASASAEASYGNYNFRDVRGGVTGPIATDRITLSLDAGYSARDGYTVNDFTGHDLDRREAEFGKGQLLFKVNERLELRLIVSGEHDQDGDYALGDLNYIRATPHHVNRDFEGYNHRDVVSGTFLANYYGDAMDFASISGVVWWKNDGLTDLDYSPAPAATRDNIEKDVQFTQEFRLSSAKDAPVSLGDQLKLKWQTGVSFFTQNYDQDAVNNYAFGVLYQPGSFGGGLPPTFSPANSQHTPLSQLNDLGGGLYGQTTLTAWDKLDFSVGVRGDYERKRAELQTFFVTPDPFLGPPRAIGARKEYWEFSPQFSVAYHCTSNHMAYLTVGRGYQAGGFNPISPAGSEEYGTEHTWNYEIGYKADWLDGKLDTTLSLFYINWQSVQLNQAVGPGAPGQFYIANAGGADSKGVEFAVKYRVLPWWDLFGSVGYNEAKFLSGSSAYNANAGANQSVGGNRLPYAPTFTGNLGTQVSWSPCKEATLYARAEVTVFGDFQYDAFSNTAGDQSQSTYSLASFRAGLRGTHWFAEGWADNAFDTHYVPIAIQYGALGAPSGYVGESGAPVTYGVRAGINF